MPNAAEWSGANDMTCAGLVLSNGMSAFLKFKNKAHHLCPKPILDSFQVFSVQEISNVHSPHKGGKKQHGQILPLQKHILHCWTLGAANSVQQFFFVCQAYQLLHKARIGQDQAAPCLKASWFEPDSAESKEPEHYPSSSLMFWIRKDIEYLPKQFLFLRSLDTFWYLLQFWQPHFLLSKWPQSG